MNTIIAAYPQFGMKQLLFRNMIKKIYDGTPQSTVGADIIAQNVTATKTITPFMYDGEYGVAIPLNTKTDFVNKIAIRFLTDNNTQVDCIIDTFFYARQHRMNINENGENTHIPMIYLRNNNNNVYVTLNRAMVETQNVTKYEITYEDCDIIRSKKLVMFGDLPDELFNANRNKYPQITSPN
jgi:hypothetical protein